MNIKLQLPSCKHSARLSYIDQCPHGLPFIQVVVNRFIPIAINILEYKCRIRCCITVTIVKVLVISTYIYPHSYIHIHVTNLAYASKLVETVIAKQLQHYLFSDDLFPISQSPNRPNHSTETALLKVTNDIFINMNDQRVTLPLLLDLSAAFDSVDHDTLLHRLQFTFGVSDKVLSWFSSYLSGRS